MAEDQKMVGNRCLRCKRPLKNPKWIAIGYGGKCYAKTCAELTKGEDVVNERINK